MRSKSSIDHSYHAGRVRIVTEGQLQDAVREMQMLYPHEQLLTLPLGCHHVVVYTGDAPAMLIDERIDDHLREVEHKAGFLTHA